MLVYFQADARDAGFEFFCGESVVQEKKRREKTFFKNEEIRYRGIHAVEGFMLWISLCFVLKIPGKY